MFSNLSHVVPMLRELGVRVSTSRLYNEYKDQVERARGLRRYRARRTVTLAPRVTIARVALYCRLIPRHIVGVEFAR